MSYDETVEQMANLLGTWKFSLGTSENYYNAQHRLRSIGLSTPPEMRMLTAAIGWPRLYVDAIEERLDIEGFRLSGQSEAIKEMTDWWQYNNMDEESSMSHLDALVYGRSYVTVAAPGKDDEPGVPIIRVESPLNMMVETDPRTRKATRALRLYEQMDDSDGELNRWATLYLPDRTLFFRQDNSRWVQDAAPVIHRLGIVPVVPILNRQRLSDHDGQSEITPEIRSFTDAAARTFMNMQAAAELMALPQRIIFGVDAEDLGIDPDSGQSVMDAYLGRIIAIENEAAKAMSFTAADLRNFTEVLDQLAKHVAAYTGLPPQYLSFQQDNPASAEAIKSSESRLVKKCERKSRMYGGSWESVMRLSAKVVGQEGVSPDLHKLETVWADPSTPTYASKVDAATKAYANGLGIIPKERARIDVGYSAEEREEMKSWDQDEKNEFTRQLKEATAIAGTAGTDTSSPSSGAKKPGDLAKPGVNKPARATRTASTTKA